VKFDVGFIPFPGPDSSGILAGGLGGGTFVSAKTQAPQAAIEFLDWMQTPQHGQWQISHLSTIPAFPVDTSNIKAGPLFKQVLDQTSQLSSGSGDFGVNIDVLTPEQFNQAMWSGLQSVLTGSKSPQEVASSMQSALKQANGS
jgi:raffinose/stachyose/melibiose transport system substrate-binding protein